MFSQTESIRQLYYDKEHNKFKDEDGCIIFDIFSIIQPFMFYQFLEQKEYMVFKVGAGMYVELIYPDDEYEEEDLPNEYYY